MNRREFVKIIGMGAASVTAAGPLFSQSGNIGTDSGNRPNILWISAEDICPNLGCYGDEYATTPHIDKLAVDGIRYTNAFSVGPICSPSRSSIISCMYSTTIGAQHHRSFTERPDFLKFFPYYLRQVGYFCTNNAKCDYNMNFNSDEWDENGKTAHWRNRKSGQPFFSVFNLEESHSSVFYHTPEDARKDRTFLLKEDELHDPDKAPVPGFLPDKPMVRERMALYYDSITQIDYHVGEIMDELEKDGLLDDTIVFFWGDHGAGYPRGKTYVYDDGVRVPLIVRFPEKYEYMTPKALGWPDDRIVTLMDLGPTMLSLAGVAVPDYYHGEAFLGSKRKKPRPFAIATRDRFDFRHELIRSVRDKKYRYIRNFFPHTPYSTFWPDGGFFAEIPPKGSPEWEFRETSQPVVKIYDPDGAFMAPITEDKKDVLYWQATKPFEELYDIEKDPEELNNLAGLPEYKSVVEKMRKQLYDWMIETRDLGLIDEPEMLDRADEYDFVMYRVGEKCDNFPRILETADLSRLGKQSVSELKKRLGDSDSAVRYWAIMGLLTLNVDDEVAIIALRRALKDESISVRLAAADALCRFGKTEGTIDVFLDGLKHKMEWTRGRAVAILSYFDKETCAKMKDLIEPLDEAIEKEKNSLIKDYVMKRVRRRIELSMD